MHRGKRSRRRGSCPHNSGTTTRISVGALAAPHTPRHGSPPNAKTTRSSQWISFRFLVEAMIGRSFRFLREATGIGNGVRRLHAVSITSIPGPPGSPLIFIRPHKFELNRYASPVTLAVRLAACYYALFDNDGGREPDCLATGSRAGVAQSVEQPPCKR